MSKVVLTRRGYVYKRCFVRLLEEVILNAIHDVGCDIGICISSHSGIDVKGNHSYIDYDIYFTNEDDFIVKSRKLEDAIMSVFEKIGCSNDVYVYSNVENIEYAETEKGYLLGFSYGWYVNDLPSYYKELFYVERLKEMGIKVKGCSNEYDLYDYMGTLINENSYVY